MNKEQKAYEEALQQAKEKIQSEEFVEAKELLTKAIASGYEENSEAKSLLEQIERYEKLESLLSEGKFDEALQEIEAIISINNGSTVISKKAEEFRAKVEEKQQQYVEIETTVNEALELVKENKYEEANEKLKGIDLTKYEDSYFNELKTTVNETIAENDKQIAAIKAEEQRKAEEERKRAEAERKAKEEAERKAKEEAERKKNKLNWSYDEIHRYIADYFGHDPNHVIVEVYDRSSTGYKIEARHDNAAAGQGDPNVAPALGFFIVDENGRLYQMDIVSAEYVLVE